MKPIHVTDPPNNVTATLHDWQWSPAYMQSILGNIKDDVKGRWADGTTVTTSLVTRIERAPDGTLFAHTLNSVYKLGNTYTAPRSLQTNITDIKLWAEARNLIKGSTPDKQFLKLAEEVGEIAAALARGNLEEAKDGIGDTVVVLTILAEQLGFPIETAIDLAYNTIKDRKGKMVEGIWIKDI